MEQRRPGEDDYEHWRELLPVDEVEYTATFRTKLLLPRGRSDLQHEIGDLQSLQDDCTQVVAGSLEIRAVTCNGLAVRT